MNPSMQACQLSVQFPSVVHEFSPCTTMMLLNFDSFFLYDSIDACTLELYCHQLNYGLDSAFQLQQDFLDLGITTLNFMYKLREVYPSFPHMFVLLDWRFVLHRFHRGFIVVVYYCVLLLCIDYFVSDDNCLLSDVCVWQNNPYVS